MEGEKGTTMIRVFGMAVSGNCHKVRVTLDVLGLPYQWNEVDTVRGETRTPEFLAMNPNGKVPLLEIEPGTYLPESNAILCYLADGTRLMPPERLAKARVMQWLFFEQYSHEPYIAVARFLRKFHPDPESQRAVADSKMAGGYRALEVMEDHLSRAPFFAADRFTIADITTLVAIDFGQQVAGLKIDPALANLGRWYQAASSRPSAKA